MTLEECYAAIDGDYRGVMSRLYSDMLVEKFMFKFLDDKSYENLGKALADADYETAFMAAHTLKGICQNLGFDKLFESSNKLNEILRPQNGNDLSKIDFGSYMAEIDADYNQTASVIKKYRDEK